MLDLIGDTPLVRLPRLSAELKPKGEVVAKLEFFNPLSSVKDRIGVAMIETLEAKGILKPGLHHRRADLAATPASPWPSSPPPRAIPWCWSCRKACRLERRKMLLDPRRAAGADPGREGHARAPSPALQEILQEIPGSVSPQQFENAANPAIHQISTAEEIWNDTAGAVDAVISGVGTGGTITGVGHALKARKPSIRMIAVEPQASAVLSGGQPGPHKIQGIGAGFIPPILDRGVIDEVVQITNEESFEMARRAARVEGLPVGISSGGALSAAFRVAAREEMEGRLIVAIIPSFAERYLSTALFEGL